MTGSEIATTTLEVVDRRTGEIIPIKRADTLRLAEFIVNQQEVRVELGEAETAVSDEILDRLDKSASWTERVGDPTGDVQYEIKAPSPSAGTESYPRDLLHDALAQLVGAGVISETAASGAMQRRLVLELDVPWDEDPVAMADQVRDAVGIHVAGVQVTVARAEAASKVSAAGVKALLKVPGAASALADARVTQDPPKRRVKVTEKTRSSR